MRSTTRRPSPVAVALNYILSITFIIVGIGMLVLIAPILYTRYTGATPPAPFSAPQSAPIVQSSPIAPQAAPLPAPAAPAPAIIVQQVPANEAPQLIQFQPVAPSEEGAPAERPIVIVQHVDDHGNQSITGSGACAVARGARRCGK
jgi:hypothetical protein